MVSSVRHEVATTGQDDVRDLTSATTEAVASSGLMDGIVTVAVIGSTAGVTTIEFEPGAVADLTGVLATLAPRDGHYEHHRRWGDDNGSSHVRAALVGPSLTIPFEHGRLTLGTWQQIVLLEFDTRPRQRVVVIQLFGE